MRLRVIEEQADLALKECPNCHSDLGPYLDTVGGIPNETYPTKVDAIRQVICTTCGMRGPYNTLVKTASDGWNDLPREDAK